MFFDAVGDLSFVDRGGCGRLRQLCAGWHRTALTATTRRGSRGNPHRAEILWANHTPADNQTTLDHWAAA